MPVAAAIPMIVGAAGAGINLVRDATDDSGENQSRAVPIGLTDEQKRSYEYGSGDTLRVPVYGRDGKQLMDPDTGQPVFKDRELTALGKDKLDMEKRANAIDGRAGVQLGLSGESRGALNAANQDRAMALAHGQTLQEQMAGRGPSLAQAQLQRGLDASNAQALSMANGARGGSAMTALANRQAMMQAGNATSAAAQDSAMIRSREQLAAQEQYRALVEGMSARDQQLYGMQSGRDQYNAQLADAQRARNDQMGLAYRNMRQNLEQNAWGVRTGMTGLLNSNARAAQDENNRIAQANVDFDRRRHENVSSDISSIATGGGQAAGAMSGGKAAGAGAAAPATAGPSSAVGMGGYGGGAVGF